MTCATIFSLFLFPTLHRKCVGSLMSLANWYKEDAGDRSDGAIILRLWVSGQFRAQTFDLPHGSLVLYNLYSKFWIFNSIIILCFLTHLLLVWFDSCSNMRDIIISNISWTDWILQNQLVESDHCCNSNCRCNVIVSSDD